jgi:hypothetical protein
MPDTNAATVEDDADRERRLRRRAHQLQADTTRLDLALAVARLEDVVRQMLGEPVPE